MPGFPPTSLLVTETWQAVEIVQALLEEEAGTLGLAYVGTDTRLIPEYPAVILVPGAKNKDLHATHTFNIHLFIDLVVYHAKLTIDHASRTREDLELCTWIENLLEQGEMNFGGKAIFVYVPSTLPGTLMRPKGEQVVGSRMTVEVLSQKRFPYD